MKLSENWLREFVNPKLTTDELVEQLTMAGLEVDGVTPVASEFSKVVVGELLEVNPHPDADKLVVCKVSGGDETHQVVCGAPNARAGIKVPFALVGAKLAGHKLKKAKLRGVESCGMLCSERELGISDSHEGLMELPLDAPVGESMRDYLQLDDYIIDLDLTPNRSDCLGMTGLARETGLLNSLDVQYPKIEPIAPGIEDVFSVELESGSACPRFVGRVIRNIDLKAQTPQWMREKLRRSDIRSIDPVVDVTNFVMLELNHPMHAYDLQKLTGRIVVRQSIKGEKVTLLDGSEVELDADTVLITDESGPIGMGGIMGGLSTAVTEGSRDIFLECAFFSPKSVAGRARSYGMNTDAAHRFERGVDWQGQTNAMERATTLLLEIAGGEAGPLVDTVLDDQLPKSKKVMLRADRIKRLLGVEIPGADINNMLSRLGFAHDSAEFDGQKGWLVSAPSHRFDIDIEVDLIEEISRVFGYNNLPVRTPVTSLTMAAMPEDELTLDRMRDQVVTRGYQEAITYSFVDPALQADLDPEYQAVALANPLSSEMSVMRTTLWTGLLKSLIYNLNRQQDRVRLFETGLRFRMDLNQQELTLENITQEKVLAGVVCGDQYAENWADRSQAIDFYDIKGDLESIFALTGEPDSFKFVNTEHAALQKGQSAEILRHGGNVGYLGPLDPEIQHKLDIRSQVYLFELKIDELITKSITKSAPLSRYPVVRRDIAVVVDQVISALAVRDCVKSAADDTLQNLKLFDVYQGKGIETNRKSLALGLTFQHPSRTLTDEEISSSMDKIIASLETEVGASLRI
ncbi:MAG: phenylalanine--tRNA ligase subunit beta [Gammaproteobacteria bacterium]|jgi:phenylalanyl-tRNA synthetase beta chain|nr:phenylalanine--tRNA ligase subunit beta [Gammaproteobacteria bacterium]|tara:strand:- start:6362 stop:8767 length:2406 start_codon:yes stop_codon:yes gene_type:complete